MAKKVKLTDEEVSEMQKIGKTRTWGEVKRERNSAKHVKVGADVWLTGPNPYNKESGLKKHKAYEKERPKRIKTHRKERAKNGYSYQDWINFDSFIMGVVANAMLDFLENGHSFFPIGGEQVDMETYAYPDGTLENYQATLGAIYFALSQYLNNQWSSTDDQDVAHNEAIEAMILFAAHTTGFWD